MFYLKLVLLCVWLVITCALALPRAVLRWGDLGAGVWFSRMYAWGAEKISGVRSELEGVERIDDFQPCVYVGNHQGAMDIQLFGKYYPRNTVVIGKKELIWIPFFGILFIAAGNICINRQRRGKAIAGLDYAVQEIKRRKVSLWVFPEGTRNRTEEPMLPFKKGAFYVAVQAGIPIVPIVAEPLKSLISWKEKRMDPGVIRLKLLDPIHPKDYSSVDDLIVAVRSKMLEAFLSLQRSSMT